jgi:hypothetical protein
MRKKYDRVDDCGTIQFTFLEERKSTYEFVCIELAGTLITRLTVSTFNPKHKCQFCDNKRSTEDHLSIIHECIVWFSCFLSSRSFRVKVRNVKFHSKRQQSIELGLHPSTPTEFRGLWCISTWNAQRQNYSGQLGQAFFYNNETFTLNLLNDLTNTWVE